MERVSVLSRHFGVCACKISEPDHKPSGCILKSSQLSALLTTLSPTLPIRVREGEKIYFVGQVYHEPPHTFIQGAASEGKYPTVQALLERLTRIDKTVPFDADIVSGDDWNYQETDVVALEEMLVIDLAEPDFDGFEEDGELFR